MKIGHRVSQVVSEERSFWALVPPTNNERGERLPAPRLSNYAAGEN
jgi:hypothetical protein